ncbi:XTP/dITP diphosphatase [Peptococcus simiae]|uniref:XTP/dITP diphosphatase n=1 Tax=Peptococcus simiae TaxID=1643805 RepID=UPI00397ED714
MIKLVLATHNEKKRKEMEALLAHLPFEVESLAAYPAVGEIVEDGETFQENAAIKAQTVARLTGQLALADDSGLVVEALDGAPGIYSARYAGVAHDDAANNKKLLADLADTPNDKRQAHFVCTLALALPDQEPIFVEGRLDGVILRSPVGANGFGYDPLFLVPEAMKSLAEMEAEEKNAISHRAQACAKAVPILQTFAKTGHLAQKG